ncbi:MAG: SOS response-associated peptidase [Firmicutes bacterium HGW-Firmicutes-16]|nr:MAG: SOS response-associated peptidase [Firmicutes bacterium HGW-Firmicutes-16]
MCGRYYIPDGIDIIDVIIKSIRESHKGSKLLGQMKLGEVFPTEIAPVVTAISQQLMQWGFSGFGGKGIIINARLESADTKPMFRKAFQSQRCLVPAGWYFEWRKDGVKKEKYAIRAKEPLFMAGLYQTEADTELPRFVILTRPAAPELAFIHDRMPVIIPSTAQSAWLTGKIGIMDLNAAEMIQLEYEAV